MCSISGLIIESVAVGFTGAEELCQGTTMNSAAAEKNSLEMSMTVRLTSDSAPLVIGKCRFYRVPTYDIIRFSFLHFSFFITIVEHGEKPQI